MENYSLNFQLKFMSKNKRFFDCTKIIFINLEFQSFSKLKKPDLKSEFKSGFKKNHCQIPVFIPNDSLNNSRVYLYIII